MDERDRLTAWAISGNVLRWAARDRPSGWRSLDRTLRRYRQSLTADDWNSSESDHVSTEDFETWTRSGDCRKPATCTVRYETRLGEAALMPAGIECLSGPAAWLCFGQIARWWIHDFLVYCYLSPGSQRTHGSRRTSHGATVPSNQPGDDARNGTCLDSRPARRSGRSRRCWGRSTTRSPPTVARSFEGCTDDCLAEHSMSWSADWPTQRRVASARRSLGRASSDGKAVHQGTRPVPAVLSMRHRRAETPVSASSTDRIGH